MNFKNMSDSQILDAIASSIESERISKNITIEQLALDGGFNRQTYSNFINQASNIKVGTLVQILKGLNQLDSLQSLFSQKEKFSPVKAMQSEYATKNNTSAQSDTISSKDKTVVRKRASVKKGRKFIEWGDDS